MATQEEVVKDIYSWLDQEALASEAKHIKVSAAQFEELKKDSDSEDLDGVEVIKVKTTSGIVHVSASINEDVAAVATATLNV